jgi:hypothetical protein
MNERIQELAEQVYGTQATDQEIKFAELIIKECKQAVLEVPVYYKDYRSQIEEAVIRDCAGAVLEKFGVEE